MFMIQRFVFSLSSSSARYYLYYLMQLSQPVSLSEKTMRKVVCTLYGCGEVMHVKRLAYHKCAVTQAM